MSDIDFNLEGIRIESKEKLTEKDLQLFRYRIGDISKLYEILEIPFDEEKITDWAESNKENNNTEEKFEEKLFDVSLALLDKGCEKLTDMITNRKHRTEDFDGILKDITNIRKSAGKIQYTEDLQILFIDELLAIKTRIEQKIEKEKEDVKQKQKEIKQKEKDMFWQKWGVIVAVLGIIVGILIGIGVPLLMAPIVAP